MCQASCACCAPERSNHHMICMFWDMPCSVYSSFLTEWALILHDANEAAWQEGLSEMPSSFVTTLLQWYEWSSGFNVPRPRLEWNLIEQILVSLFNIFNGPHDDASILLMTLMILGHSYMSKTTTTIKRLLHHWMPKNRHCRCLTVLRGT